MKKKDHMILIHKFLTGTINAKEDDQLRQWLEDPGNRRIFQEVRLIWESSGEEMEPMSEDEKKIERVKLLARLGEVKRQESKITRYRKEVTRRNIILTGMIILVGCLGYVILTKPDTIPYSTAITVDDQRRVILPDSSITLLNKASTISYTSASHERSLVLSGEAFFDIREDAFRPFIITAGGTVIKVTGTSFVVKAYEGEPVKVIVISGQVDVTFNKKTITLSHTNDMAVIKDQLIKTVNTDPNFNSWYTEIFHFDKTRLHDILDLLEHHFEVSFEVENTALLDCRFSGRFKNDDRLTAILNVLASSLDIHFVQDGDKYKISGAGCKPTNK